MDHADSDVKRGLWLLAGFAEASNSY